MAETEADGVRKRIYREMRVADIREPRRGDDVQVMFLESARFYKLRPGSPKHDEALNLLRRAMAEGRALKVGLASLDSDIIEEIQESQ